MDEESGDQEMSNKTEAAFHPGAAPVYPVSPPVVAGPPGQPEELAETRADHEEPNPLAAENWSAGERWPTGQLPVWADLAAQHGWTRTGQHEAPRYGEAGMHTWDNHRDWGPRWVLPTTLVVMALAVLVLLGVFVQRSNWLPVGVPLVGKDTGYAACEAISKGQPPVHAKGIMSLDQYRQAREVFADSRYAGIRDNGTKLMDLAWQAQGMGNNNLGILALMGGVADAYSGLAGGCASVGISIPSLGER